LQWYDKDEEVPAVELEEDAIENVVAFAIEEGQNMVMIQSWKRIVKR
jgi:hypothetical protein